MKRELSGTQIIVLGFLAIIIIGTLLLCLPAATRTGEATPFVDALFTAASSTCVTGLIVHDTFTYWSLFGQIVILVLIQVGGLGFVAVAVFFSMLLQKKIGLRSRVIIQESMNSTQVGGVVRMMRFVLIGTFSVELLGALLLSFRFCPQLGMANGIYYSLFHAISAFCNAGFDLMGRFGQFSSLTPFVGDVYVNVVVMVLIVLGGLGFFVWQDVIEKRFRFKEFRLHTKVVLCMSAALLLIPAILFFFLEQNASMAGMSTGEAVLASLFQSVTCRTAGFNTVDQAALSPASSFISMLLMFVGGSPGSTAGGIKTTTLFAMILGVLCMFRGQKYIQAFRRRLREDLVNRAITIVLTYLFAVVVSVIVISASEGIPLGQTFFEVFSAVGTVGLTTGIPLLLGTVSKIMLAALMLFGRVGGLTMAMALGNLSTPSLLQPPVEDIPVG